MTCSRLVRFLTLATVVVGLSALPSRAEDTKGRWQFGFGLSYYSTIDSIRSNSDIALSSGIVDDQGIPPVQTVDERPDSNMNNRPSVNDDFKVDFNASYGLTRWLAVELAGGYLKSDIGNIEAYTTDGTISFSGEGSSSTNALCGENASVRSACYSYNAQPRTNKLENAFVPVGQITAIPLHLSALVRFRPESPFDPYLGLGVGYIFTDLKTSEEFIARGEELSSRGIVSASRGEFTQQTLRKAKVTDAMGNETTVTVFPDLEVPAPGYQPKPLAAEVRNGFEWHAVGGVDYYMNERFSVFVDARYSWTNVAVDITADGFHQVRLGANDEGRLVLGQVGSAQDPYLWEDNGVGQGFIAGPGGIGGTTFHQRCPACLNDGFFETEDKNFNGTVDSGEDNGVIWVLPPGSSDPLEHIDDLTFTCPSCVGNQPTVPGAPPQWQQDTEDANYNQRLDRFLLYGVDICSTTAGVGHPSCVDVPADTLNGGRRYVWPGGCSQQIPQVGQSAAAGNASPEGCPAPLAAPPNLTTSGVDDVSDIYLIQGGKMSLGGFSMGVGLKFTF